MIYDYFINSLQIFVIVFVRMIGLFTTAPFFSGMAIPMRARIGLTFFVSLIAVPLVVSMGVKPPPDLPTFGVILISNFVTGAGIGFFVHLVTTSFQVSAQIFSIPMGMGMNEVMDPMSQIQVPALGNILGIMVMLLFLRVDGHIYLIQLIVHSFKEIDLVSMASSKMLAKAMLSGLLLMFEISLKIALPIIAVTLMLDMAMGLISRVAPQFNVMIMGFNIKLILGFVVIWMTLPYLVSLGSAVIDGLLRSTEELIMHMKTT